MHLDRFEIRDHRSVWGPPLELRLAHDVTAIVGPNRAGKSNLVRALAAAVDPGVPVELQRDRPVRRPDAIPEVTLRFRGRERGGDRRAEAVVAWPGGERVVAVAPEEDREALPVGPGRVVYAASDTTLEQLVAHHREHLGDAAGLTEVLRAHIGRIVPEVDTVVLDGPTVTVRDTEGFPLSRDSGIRAAGAVALARHLADRGVELGCTIVENPEVWLHPAAQEAMRDCLDELAVATDAPVVITTGSPFVTPRSATSRVIAVAKDVVGRTRFVGAARGDEPQSALLGGLFHDPGLAAVLDRTSRISEDTAGVLVVEGGTDEAYLRLAAERLGRAGLLERLVITPAGGAMAAALQAIVQRAESTVPLLVLLDNDDPGRRAKETLTGRFDFDNRRQVMTYAEVIPDHPVGAEAEDLFDWRLVGRFVEERGAGSTRGQRILRADEWHYDLTSASKSAFVGWLDEHVERRHLARWGALLDLLADRLGPGAADR